MILKDAPILMLDEATSALDSEVEAAIQGTLHGMMQGKTVIAIAHRLSTIAQMDRIIVMAEGRIIEDGTHDSLLADNGQYARFWRRQSGGFLGQEEGAVEMDRAILQDSVPDIALTPRADADFALRRDDAPWIEAIADELDLDIRLR